LEDELPNNYVDSEDVSHIKREPGITIDSDFLTCPTCGNGFNLFAGETKCPFCYTMIGEEQESLVDDYNTEQDRIQQSIADSGEFLTSDANEIQQQALDEAAAADQTIERIPDPTEKIVPIKEPPNEDQSLMAKFKRCFGGK